MPLPGVARRGVAVARWHTGVRLSVRQKAQMSLMELCIVSPHDEVAWQRQAASTHFRSGWRESTNPRSRRQVGKNSEYSTPWSGVCKDRARVNEPRQLTRSLLSVLYVRSPVAREVTKRSLRYAQGYNDARA